MRVVYSLLASGFYPNKTPFHLPPGLVSFAALFPAKRGDYGGTGAWHSADRGRGVGEAKKERSDWRVFCLFFFIPKGKLS